MSPLSAIFWPGFQPYFFIRSWPTRTPARSFTQSSPEPSTIFASSNTLRSASGSCGEERPEDADHEEGEEDRPERQQGARLLAEEVLEDEREELHQPTCLRPST